MEAQATPPIEERADFVHYQRGQKVITVVLRHDKKTEQMNFRCVNCGKLLFKYQNPLILIFDGAVEQAECPVEVICDKCKLLYRID